MTRQTPMMKRRPCFFVPLLLLALFLMSRTAEQGAEAAERSPRRSVWETDFSRAAARAKKEGKLLLVHFYADWCGPCRKMERETLSSRALARQLGSGVIGVKVNIDRQPQLARRFGVTALPSDLFVTPWGQILSRQVGYRPQRQYLATVARMQRTFLTARKVHIARTQGRTQRPRPSSRDGRSVSQSPPVRSGEGTGRSPTRGGTSRPNEAGATVRRLIGMDGYSPVALHEHRRWVAGKPQFAWTFQGVVYWMADEREWKLFRENPRRYAPRLLGCDPVILNEADRAVAGKIRYGAFFDGELFFFASEDTRKKFRAHPLRYIRSRHVLRVEEIEGTVRR